MGTLPFALTGGFWILYLLGFNQSVATGVGFIALAGVSAEFGVVMLIYLKNALEERGEAPDADQVETAVREGALLRVRPKAMTVAVILAGLLPILFGSGARSEEHTSELQSLIRISYAVFCLKKKKNPHKRQTITNAKYREKSDSYNEHTGQ